MIVAISRFRVKNGMEEAVSQAFLDRPHLVDTVPGFLGMEVFTDLADSSTYYLITRWSDIDSFRDWHKSESHQQSHHLIPKGLKLDASVTQLVEAQRLENGPSLNLEESIADASPFLASFLRTSDTIHFISATLDGTIRVCSPAVARALRKTAQEVAGTSVWDMLTDADAEALRARVADPRRRFEERMLLNFVEAEFRPFSLQCQVDVQPDGFVLIGERRVLQESALQAELLQLNNELSVMSREHARKSRMLERSSRELERELLQRQRLMQELERSNEDLLHFAHIASHDLLEPLRTVAGFAQLLRYRYSSQLDGDAQDFINYIVTGTRRLHRLINDLLTYSRAGQPSSEVELVELNGLVEEIKLLLSRAIEENQVTFEVSDLPAIFANRSQMFQLLENLISNAIRFRGTPPPAVRIGSSSDEKLHTIWVQDNGIGIEEEYRTLIFEPFQRLHNQLTSGSGIGLALCRRIVERHGGRIWVESEFGRGSKFLFTIDRSLEGTTPVEQSSSVETRGDRVP
jgi:signal transduction histidine kinase/heme-degrading monooxygenase HmoA